MCAMPSKLYSPITVCYFQYSVIFSSSVIKLRLYNTKLETLLYESDINS